MKRAEQFARNPELEVLLQQLNEEIATDPVSDQKIKGTFKHPLVFIVGCPRSGSTLLMQWLANSGCFAAPDNFLARFYRSPYVGQLIKDMLLDPRFSFRDEFADLQPISPGFNSSLGKTTGALSANEFYFFWRELFSTPVQYPSQSETDSFDLARARFELRRLIAYLDKPFACKGLMFNQILGALADWFPEAIFLHLQRGPFFTAQSLLLARETFFKDRRQWYSFQIPEYNELKSRTPIEQVAGQVIYMDAAVRRQLSNMPDIRHISIRYEAFTENPEAVWQRLKQHPCFQQTLGDVAYNGPESFEQKNILRLSDNEAVALENALKQTEQESSIPREELVDAV